jgi:hypothetical protein
MRVALLLPVLLTVACGGSGDTGSMGNASGVPSSKRIVELSDTEKGRLCDWMVSKAGSYGTPGACDRSQQAAYPFLAYDDQAACIEDAVDATDTDCKATVAQVEACVGLLPACATLTQLASAPACAILSGC